MANGMQSYSNSGNNSAATSNSPRPYIKNEPQDDTDRFSSSFSQHPDAYSMSAGSEFQMQQGGFGAMDFGGTDSVDPSELTVQTGGGFFQGGYANSQGGSSFMGTGGALDDDDIRASFDMDPVTSRGGVQDMQYYSGINGQKSNNMDNYSHTPDGPPAGSPYIRTFPQEQYRRLYDEGIGSPSSYSSPIIGSDTTQDTDFSSGQYNIPRKQKVRPGDRSERSPSVMSPKTTGLNGLPLGGGPGSSSLPVQAMHISHRHHKSLSSQWGDGTPNSYLDRPCREHESQCVHLKTIGSASLPSMPVIVPPFLAPSTGGAHGAMLPWRGGGE